jgi:cis-L-3-hydroxyproline dehydratase
LVGWGEMAPLGAFYDPSFAGGARAAMAVLAPALIGADPRFDAVIGRRLDHALKGHPYAKSALDMACWDIHATAAGLPLAEALGGRFGDSVPLYRSVAQSTATEMAATAQHYVSSGYRRIQVKVGLDWRDDVGRMEAVLDVLPGDVVVYADANASWNAADARRFLRATRHLGYTLEQPCADHASNLSVRAACDRPFVLDESITSASALAHAHSAGLVDGITIKVARVGGVSTARHIRDLAVEWGLEVTIEDTGGAQIATAAIAHLCLSTPEPQRTHTVDFHRWVSVANGVADLGEGSAALCAPRAAGLGVVVDEAALGAPLLVVS